ncbi:hypothetical protein HU200_006071 [Digitaria exilis]|uniref:Uncharacterized protein n=1 Tax=Digitaria exilis TaxID=1010633 RepID=A0A835FRT0_9POAL|nr:hypothetical protein HU200_006071 [Digitaria exilis]
MDAAVSLSLHPHHGAGPPLPLPSTLPPPPPHHLHHRALPHIRLHSSSSAAAVAPPKAAPAAPSAAAARLTLPGARPRSPARHAPSRSSARAATGYAAALADACARAGTLRRAARDARALMSRRQPPGPQEKEAEHLDARVVALVRMLARKGKAGVVPEVLAEFAAICDHLLQPLPRLHHLAY